MCVMKIIFTGEENDQCFQKDKKILKEMSAGLGTKSMCWLFRNINMLYKLKLCQLELDIKSFLVVAVINKHIFYRSYACISNSAINIFKTVAYSFVVGST